MREMSNGRRFVHSPYPMWSDIQAGSAQRRIHRGEAALRSNGDTYGVANQYTSQRSQRSYEKKKHWKVRAPSREGRNKPAARTLCHRLWTEIMMFLTTRHTALHAGRASLLQGASCTPVSLVSNWFLRGNPESNLERRLRRRPYPPWQRKCATPSDCFL